MSEQRKELARWLLEQREKPYVWAAKGPDFFDCSGLVTAGLVAVGYPRVCQKCSLGMRSFHGAARLWDEFEPVSEDEVFPLDLAFYGPPHRVDHVVFVWGDGRVYGANGGNRRTLSPATARDMKARVCFRPRVEYRPDFRGFRKLPLPPR